MIDALSVALPGVAKSERESQVETFGIVSVRRQVVVEAACDLVYTPNTCTRTIRAIESFERELG